MKTVLVTGCSSGFGLEIARYFLARDWQVVATMRTPNCSSSSAIDSVNAFTAALLAR
jgi:NAD(P)-dependent dehydrogenase (short-subunit alcohol dehydrogenase family)